MTDFQQSAQDMAPPRPRAPVEDPLEQAHLASLRQMNDPGNVLLTLLPELRLMMGLVTAAIIIAALYFGRAILIPLALAIFLGFVLDPLVVRLKRLGLPRMPAVAVVAVATLVLIGLTGLFLANQVSTLSARLPTYQNNIVDKLRDLREGADKPPADLEAHRCVNYRLVGGGGLLPWEFARDGREIRVRAGGQLIANDGGLAAAAVRAGAGPHRLVLHGRLPRLFVG